MNRSVLIVTPFFAPQSHAAVFRAYKLAKYLPEYGWKPYVVTTDTNYLYNEDEGLLDALPPEVEIHRARYIEPSLRGLRMAFGGQDRSFKAMKENGTGNPSEGRQSARNSSSRGLPRRIYQYLLDAWLQVPDRHWTWERPAVRVASQLIKENDIPLVFTSADPYTSHRIGYQLQRQGVQWIADFRDPHTHSYWMHSRRTRVYAKQKRAERLAVESADAVTVAAESIALILAEQHGLTEPEDIHFIPTGLDEGLLNNPAAVTVPSHPYLLFVGEFLPGYGEQFFRLFAMALDNRQVAESGAKALFIGRKDVNAPLVMPLVRKYGLQNHVELIDHMPQQQLYHYIREARAALLISGRRALWWTLYAKLVDYLALQKPVIAIVPNPSEARMHLQKSGLGIFLDGDQASSIHQLTKVILSEEISLEVNREYCERFMAREQVRVFANLFGEITSGK